MKNLKNTKGFSLLEVILVLAIMMIIYSIVAPNLSKIKETMAVKSDIQSAIVMTNAVHLYETETGKKADASNIAKFLIEKGYIEGKNDTAIKPQIGNEYNLNTTDNIVKVTFSAELAFTKEKLSAEESIFAEFATSSSELQVKLNYHSS